MRHTGLNIDNSSWLNCGSLAN